jgi:hypothetical protein
MSEISAHDVFEAMSDWNGMSFVHQEAAGDMCGYIARRLNLAAASPPVVEAGGELIERCAEAARKAKIRPWHDWADIEEDDRERWRRVARVVLAAAQSGPPPPGVLLSRVSIAEFALRRISEEAGESSAARSLLKIMDLADEALTAMSGPPKPTAKTGGKAEYPHCQHCADDYPHHALIHTKPCPAVVHERPCEGSYLRAAAQPPPVSPAATGGEDEPSWQVIATVCREFIDVWNDDRAEQQVLGHFLGKLHRTVSAAMPTPSVPDTAASVLAGLVEEMRALAAEYQEQAMRGEMFAYRAETAAGVRMARRFVEAAQRRIERGEQ